MAINVVIPLLIDLEENIINATRLLPSDPSGPLIFEDVRYCAIVPENAPLSTSIANVSAIHSEEYPVQYTITGGNQDGLFTIDRRTGFISLAAHLDYEMNERHLLEVSAESGTHRVRTSLHVLVADVNDSSPYFEDFESKVTVIEEDSSNLPRILTKATAKDPDKVDKNTLVYFMEGEGVSKDTLGGPIFSIKPSTGEITLLRALDRDPPYGRSSYKLKVIVQDGHKTEVEKESKYRINKEKVKRNINKHLTKEEIQKIEETKEQKHPKLFKFSENVTLSTRASEAEENWPPAGKQISVFLNRVNQATKQQTKSALTISASHRNRKKLNPFHRVTKRTKRRVTPQVLSQRRNEMFFENLSEGIQGAFDDGIKYYNTTIKINPSRKVNKKRELKSLFRNCIQIHHKIENCCPNRLRLNLITEDLKDYRILQHLICKKYKKILASKPKKNYSLTNNLRSKKASNVLNYFHNKFLKRIKIKKFTSKNRNLIDKNYVEERLAKVDNLKNRLHRRIERDTINEAIETGNKDKGGNNVRIKSEEFCKLTDARIKMERYESPFSYQIEQTSEEELEPFLSRIYLDTNSQHEAYVTVTIVVKDINDNGPIFPNSTMYGSVQENGPIDLLVTTIEAWDADDATSGTNAQLSYSIEKNVVDEKSGQAIFNIDFRSGELRTALCCLDRETTPEYRIQVVASDGGGLKGTGTVIVRLADVNDNSPRISREEWNIVVNEAPGIEGPNNETLLELSVTDPDVSNYFLYRVVKASGKGWNYFSIRTVGSIGELFATKALDYENEDHRTGFHFTVEVTDKGPGGWNNPKHIDKARVNVILRDVNDNDPVFQTKEKFVTVKEDVPVATLLAKMTAHDIDENGNGTLDYYLLDTWGNLRVDSNGGVRVGRLLDREGVGGDTGIVKVIAVDRGTPRKSATATLTISLQDVNDCPPRLLPPHALHVLENSPAQEIGILKATDDDIWLEGNGPPFEFSLAASNSQYILDKISLTFDSNLDSGRGGAKLWTKMPLDREENHTLAFEVTLSDARGLMTSQPVYLIVDDVNDNIMKPGSKMVYLWTTKDAGLDASLGRIYVEDPDDWDLKDKSFDWIGAPHPLFSLDRETGTIYASGKIREGRYDLDFGVSDKVWHQHQVKGNVTIIVNLLSHDALAHAVPFSISLMSPTELTKNWNPLEGGGVLGVLLDVIKENVNERNGKAVVVSVYGTSEDDDVLPGNIYKRLSSFVSIPSVPSASKNTHIWISYQEEDSSFMNPIKLRGILEMNLLKIRNKANLIVNLEDISVRITTASTSPFSSTLSPSIIFTNNSEKKTFQHFSQWQNSSSLYPFPNPSSGYVSATSLASTALPLQVVDNNSTSFVSPRLYQSLACSNQNSNIFNKANECLPDSCLNGGKCVSSEQGKRCVCPGGTTEPYCKILSRGFDKGGWAWIKPIPSCVPTKISLKFLTTKSEGVILYSGPLVTSLSSEKKDLKHSREATKKQQKYPNKFLTIDSTAINSLWNQFGLSQNDFPTGSNISPLLALYLSKGKIHLSLEGNSDSIHLVLNTSDPLNDGKWHNVHLQLDEKKVSVMVDYCVPRSFQTTANKSASFQCLEKHYWSANAITREFWGSSGPLQIGGLAQRISKMADHGWSSQPVESSLEGCLSDLRINDELVDLGSPVYSYRSHSGCNPQKNACIPRCGARSTCSGGLGDYAICECPLGSTGLTCENQSVPVSLEHKSFAKVALSFNPDAFSLSFQLRIRTRSKDSTVLFLSSQESKSGLVLKLESGTVVFSMIDLTSGKSQQNSRNGQKRKVIGESFHSIFGLVSLEEAAISDGRWHSIKGGKYGSHLLLEVDNGDSGNRNETLLRAESDVAEDLLREFKLDTREGLTIGGIPHFENGVLLHVEDDLSESCIDDLRIQGKQVPLPLVLNETKWGQVTMFSGVKQKCLSPDSCKGKTCKSPLVCRDEWRKGLCRCPPGQKLINNNCKEMDMCLFGPCLNGGSCIQDKTGMSCVCRSQYSGQNCEWDVGRKEYSSLYDPVILTVSIFLLVFIASFVVICCHLRLKKRSRGNKEREVENPPMNKAEDLEIFYIFSKNVDEDNPVKASKEPRTEVNIAATEGILQLMTAETPEVAQMRSKVSLVVSEEGTCRDDLRKYAYEGENSSNNSLTSVLSGQQRTSTRDGKRANGCPDTPSYGRYHRFTERSSRLLISTSEACKATVCQL